MNTKWSVRLIGIALLLGAQTVLAQTSVLFVGNSFTFGFGDTAQIYNNTAITDHNATLHGGVPGIFKKFADEKGLNYNVHIEAVPGETLKYHYDNKLGIITGQPWDVVVLQDLSTGPIPASRGGDPPRFFQHVDLLQQAVHAVNPAARVYLYETWARADLTYGPTGPYFGEPIETMFNDLHNAYYLAAALNPNIDGVAPVGDAWLRAIHQNLARRNPDDPFELLEINLWAADDYHASNFGSYLSALVHFGRITGLDPRSLGAGEEAAFALGILPGQAVALQQIAFEQLAAAVPEPSTYALMAAGLFVVVVVARRRRASASAAALH